MRTARFHHQKAEVGELKTNEERIMDSAGGRSIEIDVTLDMGNARETGRPPEVAPFRLGNDKRVRLRIFVAQCIIEVFASLRLRATIHKPGRCVDDKPRIVEIVDRVSVSHSVGGVCLKVH